jgi:LysM repeat protein
VNVKTSNPFNVPGSQIVELQQKRRTRFQIVVSAVLAANVFLFSGLLIQGCQRQPTAAIADDTGAGSAAADTNVTMAASQPAAATNPVPSPAPPSTSSAVATQSPPEPAPPSPPTATKDYAVAKGDSFYNIARANHVSVKALAEANPGVDSSKLKIGQTLHVPQAADASPAPAAATSGNAVPPAISAAPSEQAAPKADSPGTPYVVKRGDTLDRIAKAHGTTAKAVKAANGLTTDRVVVGKTLKLPEA